MKNYRLVLAIVVVAIFFITRLTSLNSNPPFEDNFSWLYRINYYPWIVSTNLKGGYIEGKDLGYAGYISYHPGVTIMTFSGFSNKIAKKIKFMTDKNYEECAYMDYQCPYLNYELYWAKFPLVLVSGLLFGYTVFLFAGVFGIIPSVIWSLLILFEPISVDLSKDLHLDFIFFMFTISAVVGLLDYLRSKRRFFVLPAVFFGFALLTRFMGVLFLPAILFVFIMYKGFLNGFLNFFKFLLISILTFIAVYPPMWVAPIQTIKYILISSRGITDDLVGLVPFHIRYYNGVLYYFELAGGNFTLIFWTVFVFGGLLAFYIKSKEKKKYLLSIFIIFITYMLFVNVSDKRYLRYILPSLFGIVMVSVAGITESKIFHYLKRFLSRFFPRIFSGQAL